MTVTVMESDPFPEAAAWPTLALSEDLVLNIESSGQLRFYDSLSCNTLLSSYQAVTLLSIALHEESSFDELKSFLTLNGIEPPAEERRRPYECQDVRYPLPEALTLAAAALESSFGFFYELFPIETGSDGFYGQSHLTDTFIRASYAATIREFLEAAFGCYRKDLVKAVTGSRLEVVAWASIFADALPIDWLIEYMKSKPSVGRFGGISTAAVRQRLFEHLTPKELKAMLFDSEVQELEEIHSGGLTQAFEKLEELPPSEELMLPPSRDAVSIYRYLALKIQGIDMMGDAIAVPEELWSLTDEAVAGYRLSPLLDNRSYQDMAGIFKNCLGELEYIERAFDRTGFVFLGTPLDESTELNLEDSILMEIRLKSSSWVITQIRCRFNDKLPQELYAELHRELGRALKCITPSVVAPPPEPPALDPIWLAEVLATATPIERLHEPQPAENNEVTYVYF